MEWIYPTVERKSEEGVLDFLLRSRGIVNTESFLSPALSDLAPFAALYDVVTAAKVISTSIQLGEQIYIHGDFDVDGVCATSILWDFLYRHAKAKVLPFIPSRFDQGYGLTESSLSELQAKGAQLVITVDCGIKDIALVRKYSQLGIKFVITDHHTLALDSLGMPEISGDALAVVHPKHPRQAAPFTEVCGTTVAWRLVQAINSELSLGIDTDQYLDRVALATVCDVMPLISDNRTIVKYGLTHMRNTTNPGLRALLEICGVESSQVDTYHFGYVLGPRLNAAGRIEDAMLAVKLLTTSNYEQALSYAQKLQKLNSERQELTQTLLSNAESQIQSEAESLLYFVYGEEWPEGIVGLVAGKLAEKYRRPVIVGSQSESLIKASARSVSGFHLANALSGISKLLERHGGHELAAGLSLRVENLALVKSALQEQAMSELANVDLTKKLKVDLLLDPKEITESTAMDISVLGPFGFGNTEPTIAVVGVTASKDRTFGSNGEHRSFKSSDLPGVELVFFNAPPDLVVGRVSIAGKLAMRTWRGQNSLQIRITDLVNNEPKVVGN